VYGDLGHDIFAPAEVLMQQEADGQHLLRAEACEHGGADPRAGLAGLEHRTPGGLAHLLATRGAHPEAGPEAGAEPTTARHRAVLQAGVGVAAHRPGQGRAIRHHHLGGEGDHHLGGDVESGEEIGPVALGALPQPDLDGMVVREVLRSELLDCGAGHDGFSSRSQRFMRKPKRA